MCMFPMQFCYHEVNFVLIICYAVCYLEQLNRHMEAVPQVAAVLLRNSSNHHMVASSSRVVVSTALKVWGNMKAAVSMEASQDKFKVGHTVVSRVANMAVHKVVKVRDMADSRAAKVKGMAVARSLRMGSQTTSRTEDNMAVRVRAKVSRIVVPHRRKEASHRMELAVETVAILKVKVVEAMEEDEEAATVVSKVAMDVATMAASQTMVARAAEGVAVAMSSEVVVDGAAMAEGEMMIEVSLFVEHF